ncbi:LemA family protein [Pantoea sp. 18069]|uniref:LemA family protein n=1 Tax=Pantoea sp. 18069 TaxID=2681415 RepID=UPI001F3869FD|nr:LemA family protein [Pantoea sp. 18069]
MIGWTVVVVVAVAVVAWAVMVYNRLVVARNRIANAFGQIDVQLKRRHDLVPNLVEVARGYMAHEASTLEAVIRARGAASSAADQARARPADAAAIGLLSQAESVLGAQLGRLMMLSEAYPELKADAHMLRLSEEITSTENRIGFARQAYNDQVLEFNNSASQFPEVLLARSLGFAQAAMLESTTSDAERAVPQLRF